MVTGTKQLVCLNGLRGQWLYSTDEETRFVWIGEDIQLDLKEVNELDCHRLIDGAIGA